MLFPGNQRPKNFGLDAVRATAIMLVLLDHSWKWWFRTGGRSDLVAGYAGMAGVEIFFSLSGFLIGSILIRLTHDEIRLAEIKTFWSRRWLRTLPAYWAVLLLLNSHFSTTPWYDAHFLVDLTDDWYSPFFLQNFVSGDKWTQFSTVTWSLTLEEWFYFFFPILLGILGKFATSTHKQHMVPMVCGVLIFASVLIRFFAWHENDPFWGPNLNINPLLRLDCATSGVLAAWVANQMKVSNRQAAFCLLIGIVCILAMLRVWIWTFESARWVGWLSGFAVAAYQSIRPILIEAPAAFIVLGAYSVLPTANRLTTDIVGFIARISYSLYLVHLPIFYFSNAHQLSLESDWVPKIWVTFLVFFGAWVLHKAIELPVIRFRDKSRLHPRQPLEMN